MYKDLHRIEDALLPYLFEDAALSHIAQDANVAQYYEKALGILKETIEKCFIDLSITDRVKLHRRLYRIAKKISDYFVKNKFTTRKMFLTISQWNLKLIADGRLFVEDKSSYETFLSDLDTIIVEHGYGEIEDFEKIDASAISHVPKIHKIAQQQGYFL